LFQCFADDSTRIFSILGAAQAWQSRAEKVAHGGPGLSDLERLLYLALKNLADLEASAPSSPESRTAIMSLYSDALLLDDSDALVWLRIGRVAIADGAVGVARESFEEGLQLHPDHPLLMAGLLHLLIHVRISAMVCQIHRDEDSSRQI
jgi:cytochrome c-type biogenesis protein CcmH/NrfG